MSEGNDGGLKQEHLDFHLGNGTIRVKIKKHGPRSYLEVRSMSGTMEIVPQTNKTALVGTLPITIRPDGIPFHRVRPKVLGRRKHD